MARQPLPVPPDTPNPPVPSEDAVIAADDLRIAVLACAVLEDEVHALVADAPQAVHIEMMPQGLHNDPPRLRNDLQLAINRIEAMTTPEGKPLCNAIALVYGLCSRGTEGIHTTRCSLVIARAHDCITLLLGDRHRYAAYVAANPGTYWYSVGWNRHHIPPGPDRYTALRRVYVEKYGEDNADYLMEQETTWMRSYNRATFVDLTVGKTDHAAAQTRDCAQWLGWTYDHQVGDPTLLRDLVTGVWDTARFAIARPGWTFQLTPDESVLETIPAVLPSTLGAVP